jgi:hypothetical protein
MVGDFLPYGGRCDDETMKRHTRPRGIAMALAGDVDLMQPELDAIAWEFLRSAYAGHTYASWPIDDRLEGYLLNRGLVSVANDGSASDALLQCVMANIGRALRTGTLAPQTN